MKIFRIGAAAAAFGIVAAGLIAPPAQAALKLPAGCVAQDRGATSIQDVYSMTCRTLADGVDLRGFENLFFLELGELAGSETYNNRNTTLTRLPMLPDSLEVLAINATKLKNFSGLKAVPNLRNLTVFNVPVVDFPGLARATPNLQRLELMDDGYKQANFRPLSKLKNLQNFSVISQTSNFARYTEGVSAPGGFARDLDGNYVLPANKWFTDNRGKKKRTYTFDKSTGRIQYHHGTLELQTAESTKLPKTMPSVRNAYMMIDNHVDVAGQAEWFHDQSKKMKVTGTRAVGSVLKISHPYADKFQWYRNGRAVKAATRASYKLTKSDLHARITVRGTDTRPTAESFYAVRTVPYSQAMVASARVDNVFSRTHAPKVSGVRLPGYTLKATSPGWTPKATNLSYQWKRNGVPIKGATRTTYKISSADKGRKISVTVTGRRSGYANASKTSQAVWLRR